MNRRFDVGRICRIGGLVVLAVFVCLPVLSLLPPESKHSHTAKLGPHDELVKWEPKGSGLAQLVEPIYDIEDAALDLAGTEPAHGHYPFPKFCGHYDASKPNHLYDYYNQFNSGGAHYHRGAMVHGIGSDYNYTYKCGTSTRHYRDWPQGWF